MPKKNQFASTADSLRYNAAMELLTQVENPAERQILRAEIEDRFKQKPSSEPLVEIPGTGQQLPLSEAQRLVKFQQDVTDLQQSRQGEPLERPSSFEEAFVPEFEQAWSRIKRGTATPEDSTLVDRALRRMSGSQEATRYQTEAEEEASLRRLRAREGTQVSPAELKAQYDQLEQERNRAEQKAQRLWDKIKQFVVQDPETGNYPLPENPTQAQRDMMDEYRFNLQRSRTINDRMNDVMDDENG